MRLNSLTIRTRFKNLSNFTIDFDEHSATTVIVGRNGSGKSNILEALTLIFRDLDLKDIPAFSYTLDYVCRGQHIHVDADPTRKAQKGYEISVGGEPISFNSFSEDPDRKYLPNYVFGYYSGPSNRMESHFIAHQDRFYTDLINGKDRPLRPLFYARPVHSQFVLLAFYMEQDEEIAEFLRKQLRIVGLDYALFVMREPPWKSKEGDPRFWRARGVVSDLLDKLYALATAPLRMSLRIPIGFRKVATKQHLYLFLKSVDEVQQLSKQYMNKDKQLNAATRRTLSQQEFFKALESTYISELISEVRINVKALRVDGSLTFREMSEGEQQLLMVLGLLRFTREDESLFLLDEPDTHLNPAWSVQYLDFLRRIGGAQDTSHVIMATHDPLVVIGLEKEQVQVLHRDEDTSQITAEPPTHDPKRMSIASLLTSDIYGLRSAMSVEMLKKLDDLRLLRSQETHNDAEKLAIERLEKELGGIDSTVTMRDPTYDLFVQAMAELEREQGLDEVVLTPEQKEKQRSEAKKILDRLKSEAKKK